MNLPDLESFLPIGVWVAIGLFIAKEAFEYGKRKAADNRKRKAIRTLLANECERNNWSISAMKYIFYDLIDLKAFENGRLKDDCTIRIFKDSGGENHFRLSQGQKSFCSVLMPSAQRFVLEKSLIDIALVDGGIFPKAIKAYESVINLDFLISRTIGIVSDETDAINQLRMFAPHTVRALQECYSDINALYRECVGKELTDERAFGRRVPKPRISFPEVQSSDKCPAADR